MLDSGMSDAHFHTDICRDCTRIEGAEPDSYWPTAPQGYTSEVAVARPHRTRADGSRVTQAVAAARTAAPRPAATFPQNSRIARKSPPRG